MTGDKTFSISTSDRVWIEENFKWLIEIFGYPNQYQPLYSWDEKHFPESYNATDFLPHRFVEECARLFELDIENTLDPYPAFLSSSASTVLKRSVVFENNEFRMYLPSDLYGNRDLMVRELVLSLVEIKMREGELEFDMGGDDNHLFMYAAAIFLGAGFLLVDGFDGRSYEQPVIRWDGRQQLPARVYAFMLAFYCRISGCSQDVFLSSVNEQMRKVLIRAFAHLDEHPSNVFVQAEIDAHRLFSEADEFFENNLLEEAEQALQKVLFVTSDDHMKADVYNNMGYCHLRMGNLPKSITCFRKALSFGSEFGYANDNLGYALILSGELEKGKIYLDKAVQTRNNDLAYSYRNYALYYFRLNDFVRAEEMFNKAFAADVPVDLLEYHYSQFLIARGERDHAVQILRRAAGKNEPEVLNMLEELATK
jgi:Tfp pilus assembly protein PilF